MESVTADILLTLSLLWVVVVGGGSGGSGSVGGMHTHFRVEPNLGYVRLRLVRVGVKPLTKFLVVVFDFQLDELIFQPESLAINSWF